VKAPPPALLGWTGGMSVSTRAISIRWQDEYRRGIFLYYSRGAGYAGKPLPTPRPNQFNNRSGGFLGGAQAGYNYQFSPSFVAGWEADIQGSTLRQNLAVRPRQTTAVFSIHHG